MEYKTLPKKLEQWASEKAPGLRTYLEREGLRDADKLIRDELAKKLDEVREVFEKAKSRRVDKGRLKNLDKLDRAVKKIEKVRDTIRFDSRGYRGIFDPEEVAEDELLALLEYDEKLFGSVEGLAAEAKKAAEASEEELIDALYNFEDKVAAFDASLGERENYSKKSLPGPSPGKE